MLEGNYDPSKRVYKQGCIAAANKMKVGDNPYHEKDRDHWRWMHGFSETLSQLSQ